jgi:hypothetical protein
MGGSGGAKDLVIVGCSGIVMLVPGSAGRPPWMRMTWSPISLAQCLEADDVLIPGSKGSFALPCGKK